LIVQNESLIITEQAVALGAIGEHKAFLLGDAYNETAVPKYIAPIKVSSSLINFNKRSFKAFQKANIKKTSPFEVKFIDSLASVPQFIKLELVDRVGILNAINSKSNLDVQSYLKLKKDAHIVTAISVYFEEDMMKSIMSVDALFLEQDSAKTFILKGYLGGKLITHLTFNEGVVFAYQTSNFCWRENDKNQLALVDIVERKSQCPNGTYRRSKRAKKTVDYFKI
jgi:hypothetical protein